MVIKNVNQTSEGPKLDYKGDICCYKQKTMTNQTAHVPLKVDVGILCAAARFLEVNLTNAVKDKKVNRLKKKNRSQVTFIFYTLFYIRLSVLF